MTGLGRFGGVGFEREAIKRGGFVEFVRRAWRYVEPGKPFAERWYHRVICDTCEQGSWSNGNDYRFFGFNLPPATLKSTIVSVLWPAWHWGAVNAAHGILGASYDQRLQIRDARKMLELVTSDWYRGIYPHVIVPNTAGVTDYTNSLGGFRISSSILGKITGRHPRLRIIDDPTKPIRLTQDALFATNAWYGNTWSSRGDEPTKVIEAVVMQRLNRNDLSAHLQKLGHKFTSMGAEYRAALACPEDIRTIEGELLDPDRLPQKQLEILKISMGEDFEIQYNQNAIDKKGQIFNREDILLVDSLPDTSNVQASCISVDCTFKATEDSDYIAIHVWLLVAGVFYLVDVVDVKADFVDTLDLLKQIIVKWPSVFLKLIEDKANGPAVISVLKRKVPGVQPVTPLGGKIDRAQAIAPLLRTGSVAVLAHQPWTERVLHQIHHFPRAANDDHVDAMSQALAYMLMQGYGDDGNEYANLDTLRSLYS